MAESKKIYNEIREKLKILNEINFPSSDDDFNDTWENGINDFKININRLNENLSFKVIGELPNEALIILEEKLNSLIKNCEHIKRLGTQKNEYIFKLKKHFDALEPNISNSTIMSRNGKALDHEELIVRKKDLELLLEKINNKIENTFYQINRVAEDIYFVYCLLLEQAESPIRIFVNNKLEEYFQPLVKKFKKDLDDLYFLQERKFLDLENSYSSLFERFSVLDKSLSENVQDYQKIQEDISSLNLKINKEINSAKLKYEDKIDHLSEKFRDILIQEDNDLKKESKRIKNSHSDFIKIVENAGIYKLTENYNKKADEEKVEYKTYRKFTSWAIIAAILTTIIILGIPVYEYWEVNPPVDTNYFTVLARLTISVMFFVLALYLSKQASKHYECYQENHKTFLQLAALEPFISRMSDEDKLFIRKTLVPVYFSQDKDGKYATKGDEVDLSANTTSVIHKLIDVLGSKSDKIEVSSSKENS